MLTIEEVIKKLEPMNLSKVSRDTNISYALLWKVVNDKMARAPYDVVKSLSDYLEAL